ncbi:MAG: dihydrofolate reductase family protein [Myxococcales bacterium]
MGSEQSGSEQSEEVAELVSRARELAEAQFGLDVLGFHGVSQVSATARGSDGRLHVLDIGSPATPQSEADFFGLNLARARSDALLTSAENVRREPALSHRLAGAHALALTALRRALGKANPPLCAILSGSGNLPLEHPVWHDGTPKLVLTRPEGSAELERRLGARAQVIALPDLSARTALSWLRAQVPNVSVEAGPSTSGQLFEAPPMVDELLLSRFEGALSPAALGKALPDDALLFRGLRCVHETSLPAREGTWLFQRWVRVVASATNRSDH